MADRVHFTAEEVATWLEEADEFGRARWPHWPDAKALAADLSRVGFNDRFIPHYAAVREVRQVAAMLRKASAAALENPTIFYALIMGAAHAVNGKELKDLAEDLAAGRETPDSVADRFPRLLRCVADAAEEVITKYPWREAPSTHADALRFVYGWVAKTLERHTGKPASIRDASPDARFVRDVIEHAGLPWRPRTWRRYGEEWKAVRRELAQAPAVRHPKFANVANQDGLDFYTLTFHVYPKFGYVTKTRSVSNRRQKKK